MTGWSLILTVNTMSCDLQLELGYVKLPDTRVSSIVCFAILVLPVLLNEEYWSFQYRVFYNTSITSIAG